MLSNVKIFHSCRTSVVRVALCHSCLTRVTLVSHSCRSYRTRVARVWHSCKIDEIEFSSLKGAFFLPASL